MRIKGKFNFNFLMKSKSKNTRLISYSWVKDLLCYFNGVITGRIIRKAMIIVKHLHFILVDITFYLKVKLDL